MVTPTTPVHKGSCVSTKIIVRSLIFVDIVVSKSNFFISFLSGEKIQLAISSFVYIADDTNIKLNVIKNYSKCTQ